METPLPEEPEEDLPGREVAIILAVFFEASLAPLSVLLGWLLSHPPFATFAWDAHAALLGAAAAVPPALLFVCLLSWPVGPFARIKRFCDEDVIPVLDRSNWSELALVALSAGVGEELLFRGVLQALLTDYLNRSWGLLLSGLLFGLLHALSRVYIVIAGLMGIYLGFIHIQTGNLLSPMVTHFVYDFVLLGYVIKIYNRSGEVAQDES
jgi:membrane protease YdiL (CAAX protease family)